MHIQMMNLFKGLERAYGYYMVDRTDPNKNKQIGKARTINKPVTEELWKKHLNGEQGLGIIPINDDGISYFGAIDIDIYPLEFSILEKKINELGLPLIICRTKSGGAHLYLFTEGINSKIVRSSLMEWSIALGYPDVEVFPKQVKLASDKDVGNWINMPYFKGDKTNRYAILKKKKLSLEDFIVYASGMIQSEDNILSIKIESDDLLKDAPPCLQHLGRAGVPDGNRNNALFNYGIYCQKRWQDDFEQYLDECNRKFLVNPGSSSDVAKICSSLRKKTYSYKCEDLPISQFCNKQICKTRKYGVGGGSSDPGVLFNALIKIDTDPPSWIVDVNGFRIDLQDTRDLIEQTRFRKICMEKIHILPIKIPGVGWDIIIQELLEKLEIIDAPEDASARGQFITLLEEFCTSRGIARTRDEVLRGKPFNDNGCTYFRSMDLMTFLKQKNFTEIREGKEVWSILRKFGAENGQWNIKGRNVKWWRIKSFDSQTEDFNKLDIPEESKF